MRLQLSLEQYASMRSKTFVSDRIMGDLYRVVSQEHLMSIFHSELKWMCDSEIARHSVKTFNQYLVGHEFPVKYPILAQISYDDEYAFFVFDCIEGADITVAGAPYHEVVEMAYEGCTKILNECDVDIVTSAMPTPRNISVAIHALCGDRQTDLELINRTMEDKWGADEPLTDVERQAFIATLDTVYKNPSEVVAKANAAFTKLVTTKIDNALNRIQPPEPPVEPKCQISREAYCEAVCILDPNDLDPKETVDKANAAFSRMNKAMKDMHKVKELKE